MDTEGLTCPACLTLNPVGAPACVRCNGPLTREAASAPVFQPARGVRPAAVLPPPPPAPAPPPRVPVVAPPTQPPRSANLTPARRQARRRMLLLGNLVVLVVVAVGAVVVWQTRPHYLDTGAVAQTLAKRLQAKVTCPQQARRTKGTQFRCRVVYVGGRRGSVQVTVTDDAGAYRWKVTASDG